MISNGRPSISKEDIESYMTQADIIGYYLHIQKIPCVINSPLRMDRHPSFALYSPNGKDINYKDFSTKDSGGCYKLLSKLLGVPISSVFEIIYNQVIKRNVEVKQITPMLNDKSTVKVNKEPIELQCKVRKWMPYDIEYWNSYGVDINLLKYCEVYPISHKIIIKGDKTMVFHADKYAYTFVERKDGKVTHKFYQPFNKSGYKWQNNHNKSVLGLWSKMPAKGKDVCICSSVKDALCLMSNINITCICLQGEGYPISDSAKCELKKRFDNVFICLDNDKTGIDDSDKLSNDTGFINVQIPQFKGGKDISDYYKTFGKQKFIEDFIAIFKEAYERWYSYSTLPF